MKTGESDTLFTGFYGSKTAMFLYIYVFHLQIIIHLKILHVHMDSEFELLELFPPPIPPKAKQIFPNRDPPAASGKDFGRETTVEVLETAKAGRVFGG